MIIREDFQLKDVTTFHLPAKARYFCEYETVDELEKILKWDVCRNLPIFHMGGGSNLLFTKDFEGVILHSLMKSVNVVDEDEQNVFVEVSSGVVWDDFVKYAIENEFYGIENLSYIPGEVGASAVQNIGSYGVEVKDTIFKVNTIEIETLKKRVFTNEECQFGYRDSIFKRSLKDKYIVTSIIYKLSKVPHYNFTYGPLKKFIGQNVSLQIVRDEIISIRTNKLPDPKYIGSAGSFFKNPIIPKSDFEQLRKKYPEVPSYIISETEIKVPAGWLVENSGLKGFSIGDAQVYPKQCLVLVNNGKARASEVVELYKTVINIVKEKFNILLDPEANIL